MSEVKNNGGLAFPEAVAVSPVGDVYRGLGGMSLRDYFAGQALTGLLATVTGDVSYTGVATVAYACADAMLAERSK